MSPHSRARVRLGAAGVRNMARRFRFACLALFALCVPRALASHCPLASFEARLRAAEVLEAAFDASGFDVQRGAMWVFSHADIKPDCRDCSHANPSSTYGCAMLPVTDDPRGILRETRAAARAAESEDDGGAPVSSARRPRASSSLGAARNVSDETGTSDARDGSFVPDSSSSSSAPRNTTEAASSTRTTTSAFTTLIGTRNFVRNSREAAASNDAPALGLAKPSETERERLEEETARVLPDGSGGARFSCEWRLREDEVVLVVGCTPPPAKYFGITPYVYKSYDGGQVRTLFASAGDTLSMGGDRSGVATFSRLGTSAGNVPVNSDGTLGVIRDVRSWNATFATAFGGHRTTLRESIDALVSALKSDENDDDDEKVSIPFVEDIVNAYGLSRVPGVKTRALMIRHAVPSDLEDWRAYAESPPFVVMRLTPRRSPMFPAPFPRAALIQRKTFDERPLASSVALVANRVAAFFQRGGFDVQLGDAEADTNDADADADADEKNTHWFDTPGRYTTRVIETSAQVLFDNGQRCLDVSWNCGGDNRDTTYVNGPRFRLPDADTVAYVIGANHVSTKNAVYANIAVYDPARKLGVLAINDGEFENTATRWTKGTSAESDAEKLFVVALARKCPFPESNQPGIVTPNRSHMLDGALCVEVPSDGFPSASPTAELAVWERPYCHAETTVGPWWSRLATPTVVLVRRVGEAPAEPNPFTFDINTF